MGGGMMDEVHRIISGQFDSEFSFSVEEHLEGLVEEHQRMAPPGMDDFTPLVSPAAAESDAGAGVGHDDGPMDGATACLDVRHPDGIFDWVLLGPGDAADMAAPVVPTGSMDRVRQRDPGKKLSLVHEDEAKVF